MSGTGGPRATGVVLPTQPARRTLLRRCVLAVAVLDDLDLEPGPDGVTLLGARAGAPSVLLPWAHIAAAAGLDAELAVLERPDDPVVRARLVAWFRLHRLVADAGERAADVLREALRPLAFPAGSALHPGPVWVQERLPGGAADLGAAVEGLAGDLDAVVPLLPDVARAAGVDLRTSWPAVRDRAERMGRLAVERLTRDGSQGRQTVLRPVGGCDVPTLLASPSLRAHLAAGDGTGLRAVAVPMRSRGWFDLARIDPAFVAAAWTATDPDERGFPRPVLVTADEVVLASPVGDVVAAALADPVRRTLDLRDRR